MAKRANEQTPQKPNSSLRVRWVEVELNGSDTSIEEALRCRADAASYYRCGTDSEAYRKHSVTT